MDANEVLIPLDRLQEGHDKCAKHMELLIDSSDILFSSRKYAISIALSILALEESAKLELIQIHLINKVGITKKEWESITGYGSHSRKLKNPVRTQVEKHKIAGKEISDSIVAVNEYLYGFPTPSYEDYQSITENFYEYYSKLNFVKQDCLYMKWDKSQWKTFNVFLENQQKALALYRIVNTKLVYYEIMLKNRYLRITRNPELKTLNDELENFRDKLIKTHELEKTKNYKNAIIIVRSMMKEYAKT